MSLYGVGGAYFVNDGDHRVSVARFQGGEWIDAEVTEFRQWLTNGTDAASHRKGESLHPTVRM